MIFSPWLSKQKSWQHAAQKKHQNLGNNTGFMLLPTDHAKGHGHQLKTKTKSADLLSAHAAQHWLHSADGQV